MEPPTCDSTMTWAGRRSVPRCSLMRPPEASPLFPGPWPRQLVKVTTDVKIKETRAAFTSPLRLLFLFLWGSVLSFSLYFLSRLPLRGWTCWMTHSWVRLVIAGHSFLYLMFCFISHLLPILLNTPLLLPVFLLSPLSLLPLLLSLLVWPQQI